jgi:hypothetical protein
MNCRVVVLSAGFVLLGLLVGCGKAKAPWEKVSPVSGVLTLGGKPIVGAQVTLFPVDGTVPESIRPTAVTDADGRFHLRTFAEADGAPAGDFRVSVIWHPLVQSDGGMVRGVNQLPAKYATPDGSGLTVTVAEGGSTLPAIDIPVP